MRLVVLVFNLNTNKNKQKQPPNNSATERGCHEHIRQEGLNKIATFAPTKIQGKYPQNKPQKTTQLTHTPPTHQRMNRYEKRRYQISINKELAVRRMIPRIILKFGFH